MPLARKLFIGIFLFLLVPDLQAQEEFVEPPSRLLTRVPFRQLTGGVIILHARLDEFPDTLNFILDTGSSGISLDSTTASYFELTPEPSERSIRGIAGIRKVSFLYDRTLHFPNLPVDSLDFHVNDYSILTAVYGLRVDGIIGYSFLSRYIVEINYDSLYMDVRSIGMMRYPKGGYLIKPVMGTLPVHHARIKDDKTHNVRFLHDIGAGLCLMLSSDFVEDSGTIHRKRVLLPKEGEGVGGSIDMKVTIVRELKVGPYRFRNVPTYIFDDDYNVTSYPYLAGIIGNDIFRRFNSIINYAKRDIYLVPNSHFRDPFDYSYAGVELYYEKGKTVLGDVAANSPAEKAGLQEGDEVVGINNNFSQNFDQYKALLQSTVGRIKMIIRRNEELMQFEFKVKSIIQRKKLSFRR
jgi:hypothetical protein